MKNRKYSTVSNRVQEFVGLPGCRQRTSLSFAIAYNSSCNQIRVVKYSSESMSDGVTKLATFINGTRCFRCAVAWNSAWEGELFEHFLHTFLILADVRINFAVGTFQIGVGDHEVSAMSRTGKQDHIKVVTFDDTVAVCINEVLSWYSSPMTNNFFLDLIHS